MLFCGVEEESQIRIMAWVSGLENMTL